MTLGHPHEEKREKRSTTVEDLEQEMMVEEEKAAAAEQAERERQKSTFGKIFAWVKGTSKTAIDAYDKISLPVGVSLDDYRRILNMFEKISDAKRGGKIVKGKGWMRIVKDNPNDEKDLGELLEDSGQARTFNSQADILDFLLERYVPHAMADERAAREIRLFFLYDLNVIPYLE